MGTDGPYKIEDTDCGAQLITGPEITSPGVYVIEVHRNGICTMLNNAWRAGRASRDGLRKALKDLVNENCHCQYDPPCEYERARIALKEDAKRG